MESWRATWRKGFVPLLSVKALRVLEKMLVEDDSRLMQGATCTTPPLQCVQDWPVEAACLIGMCGWAELDEDLGEVAVKEVEEFFARMCYECDQILGELAGCRHLLNFYDETPREEMRRLLLPEVQLALEEKELPCLFVTSRSAYSELIPVSTADCPF